MATELQRLNDQKVYTADEVASGDGAAFAMSVANQKAALEAQANALLPTLTPSDPDGELAVVTEVEIICRVTVRIVDDSAVPEPEEPEQPLPPEPLTSPTPEPEEG